MDDKVYLISLGGHLGILQIDWQSLKSLIALGLALDIAEQLQGVGKLLPYIGDELLEILLVSNSW